MWFYLNINILYFYVLQPEHCTFLQSLRERHQFESIGPFLSFRLFKQPSLHHNNHKMQINEPWSRILIFKLPSGSHFIWVTFPRWTTRGTTFHLQVWAPGSKPSVLSDLQLPPPSIDPLKLLIRADQVSTDMYFMTRVSQCCCYFVDVLDTVHLFTSSDPPGRRTKSLQRLSEDFDSNVVHHLRAVSLASLHSLLLENTVFSTAPGLWKINERGAVILYWLKVQQRTRPWVHSPLPGVSKGKSLL